MAVCGIGTDLCAIERIAQIRRRHGPRFDRRILTPAEQLQLTTVALGNAFVAKRFAAKEAIVKALGCGIGPVSFQDIDIVSLPTGAPTVALSVAAIQFLKRLGGKQIHLSLSDEKGYALAFVVIESSAPC